MFAIVKLETRTTKYLAHTITMVREINCGEQQLQCCVTETGNNDNQTNAVEP